MSVYLIREYTILDMCHEVISHCYVTEKPPSNALLEDSLEAFKALQNEGACITFEKVEI